MRITPTISGNFLLVGGPCTVDEARELLRATEPRHLVVVVGDTPDYYLLPARDFEARMAGADGTARLEEVATIGALRSVRTCSRLEALAGGEPCLVVEDEVLAGVFEPGRGGSRTRFMITETGARHRPPVAGDENPVRHVRAEMAEEATVGEAVTLAVEVGPEASPLRVELPVGSELDVVVQARAGFAVEGDAAGTVRLSDDGTAMGVEFRLRATAPGPGLVRVFVLHAGICLGTLTLRPAVHPAPGESPGAAPAPRLRPSGVLNDLAPAAPDLSLLILEQRDEMRRPVLSIRVTARDAALRLTLKEFGPVPLRMEPVAYFQDFFADIEALGGWTDVPDELVEQKLAGKGARLFESIFPAELQARLWEHRHRIGSVQIYSEESWIPWELCRLTGMADGRVVEGPFFCEAWEVTRWIPGVPGCPRLTLDNMALVLPRDSGLHAAWDEREFLLSQAGDGRTVNEIPARYLDVRKALASGAYDGFHFSGHGTTRAPDPDRSAIVLERGEELRPEEISGVLRNLGRLSPLVFLNSCRGARGAFTLVGAGGWAKHYLDAGAGAFVGAYWSIPDETASAFASTFYRELRAGKPLGAAVRAARLSIRAPGDATWLAYTVYGDPAAVVRR